MRKLFVTILLTAVLIQAGCVNSSVSTAGVAETTEFAVATTHYTENGSEPYSGTVQSTFITHPTNSPKASDAGTVVSSPQMLPHDQSYAEPVEDDNTTPANLGAEILGKIDSTFIFHNKSANGTTSLNLNADGSFYGSYESAAIVTDNEGNAKEVLNKADFSGNISNFHKVNYFTYAMEASPLSYTNTVGNEETIDGTDYVYTEASGLENAGTLYLYTPDSPMTQLSADFKESVLLAESEQEFLGYYGIYNEKDEAGFLSSTE